MASEAQSLLLAQTWKDSINPAKWIMSEKLDGVRAYWTGSTFYSRNGKQYFAPSWFTKDLPNCAMDGELWCGRGQFQKCVSVVRKVVPIDAEWKLITYFVFDCPKTSGRYEARMDVLKKEVTKAQASHLQFVGIEVCKGRQHLDEVLMEVMASGGEGIMLRKPGSSYEHKRSSTLLKVKMFHDEEARVVGHKPGKGRCANMMGGLECELPNKIAFTIGTGFDDHQRKNPPKIGAVVSFKYQEISNRGVPRFPVFLRRRGDVSWAEVIENTKTKTPFSQQPKIQSTLKRNKSLLFSSPSAPNSSSSSSSKATRPTPDESKTPLDVDPLADYSSDGDVIGSDSDAASPSKRRKINHQSRDDDSGCSVASFSSSDDDDDDRPLCRFGAQCYQRNPKHKKKYRHPQSQ
uniref:3-ketoacyl-CoA synthase 17 n=1 Tax=Hirondellea gigas TaxID=1518452 RepID=A0A6A7GCJ1_9CRUS